VDGSTVYCTNENTVIGPGDSCQFQITFTPTAPGTRTATFQLYDNSNNAATSTPGYEQITLTGTGTD
jgi:hypothetical protein